MKQRSIKIGIIIGGQSSEHTVSLTSGNCIIEAIDNFSYELTPFGINLEGLWLSVEETTQRLKEFINGERDSLGDDVGSHLLHSHEVLSALKEMDVIFPIIHGTYGEDGKLQGFLDLANIPYVGAGVAASALGMDKGLMRMNFESAGIPQPKYLIFNTNYPDYLDKNITKQIEKNIGYPCFVKPCNGGSSIGVSKTHNSEELLDGLINALEYDSQLLVEETLTGRELECGVIELSSLSATPLGEVRTTNEFYDYSSKYMDESTTIIVPALVEKEIQQQIQTMAIQAFRAVGAKGYARVDFFLSHDDKIKCIEINTHPGFTSKSMFPKLCSEFGLNYSDLISALVQTASQITPRRNFESISL